MLAFILSCFVIYGVECWLSNMSIEAIFSDIFNVLNERAIRTRILESLVGDASNG